MILKPTTERALGVWLGPDTWHTNHDLDLNRFYNFVDQYQKDHGYTIDESSLQEIFEREAGGNVGEPLQEVIRARISLANNILDFLKRTGR